MSSSDQETERDLRRQYAAYYTPSDVATSMVEWAIESPMQTLLDPSFGGCVFLGAAAQRLRRLGHEEPASALYGVDIDPRCWNYLATEPLLRNTHAVLGDFLTARPNTIGLSEVDVVLGNPPYIRHHELSAAQVLIAQRAISKLPVELPRTASLWAYFVLHATTFLKPGGKLGLVLPRSVLEAQYARPIRQFLREHFRTILYVELQERIFHHTDEAAVVLLAFQGADEREVVFQVRDRQALRSAFRAIGPAAKGEPELSPHSDSAAQDALDTCLHQLPHRAFEALGSIRIGLVTGRNKHFLVPSSTSIPAEYLQPTIPGTRHLKGLRLTDADALRLQQQDERCQLVVAPIGPLPNELAPWAAAGERAGVNTAFKCVSRTPWYRVPVPPLPPDAFATCSRSRPPLIVSNQVAWHSTNALHYVRWKANVQPHSVAVAILSTVSALWSELNGRKYGGGVLKMEPSIWKRLPVLSSSRAASIFVECDTLIRAGCETDARQLADEVLLCQEFGLARSQVADLRAYAEALAERRQPTR